MFEKFFKKSGKKNSRSVMEERNSQRSNHYSEKFEQEKMVEETEHFEEQKPMNDGKNVVENVSEVKDNICYEENNYNNINEEMYLELKLQAEEIKTKNISNVDDEKEIIDVIMINLINKYGLETVDSTIFIRMLEKLFIDQKFAIENRGGYLKDYLYEWVLNISDAEYWDEDDAIICNCDIVFFRKNILITKYGADRTKEGTVTTTIFDNSPISFMSEMISETNMWSIVTFDIRFFLNTDEKNLVERYINDLNFQISLRVNEVVNVIIEEANNASVELKEIIKNYLSIIPLEILLDKDDFIAFEQLAFYFSLIMQQSLDSSVEQREEVIEVLTKDNDFYSRINGFVIEDFSKLIKIASKYMNSNEKYYPAIIWKLIRLEAIRYLSKEWLQNYEVYISNEIKINNLDDYVDAYCRASEIPTTNIASVGILTYHLMNIKLFDEGINGNFVKCNICLIQKILEKMEEIELERFENRIMNATSQQSKEFTINDVDMMDGHEFEKFVSLLFSNMGYTTEVTKASGDQGLDVIAENKGVKIGIQAKCYTNKVTNKAVQEAFAGLSYYNCDKGMVVTNNYFTCSAIELANTNGIVLWNRDMLKTKIDELF
ncbi:MAG: restriction endonuclease [Candidatus Cloacimonetes bacterium]|nr:restriction endonuclease [Candidatus Cloacimonadota bacterium]MDY0229949.1 restriction endonuclease [Candidatus Cloacimonadaceae bacterium]